MVICQINLVDESFLECPMLTPFVDPFDSNLTRPARSIAG